MTEQSSQAKYRINNWPDYNQALKQRGSITFWLDETVVENWLNTEQTGKQGASPVYSDLAIATIATLGLVFRLAGRQTQGFVASLFELMRLELPVPDHSTISRRLRRLSVSLPVIDREGSCHVVVDSTGIKVYGEGEWKVRQHGWSKGRSWRKLHLGVDETTGEILAAVVSTQNVSDAEALGDVLDAIDGEIDGVSTDGAYDKRKCYEVMGQKQAQANIPPPA